MLSITRALGLAVLAAFAFSSAAAEIESIPDTNWIRAKNLAELTEILDDWLDLHADWERRHAPSAIELISSGAAQTAIGRTGKRQAHTRGIYDSDTETIYLVKPWNPHNAKDVSVLLHELVHHRQAPHYFYCPGAQEKTAYNLQKQWLAEQGLTLNVNWIAVVLESSCSPRDIHPD